MNTKLGFRTGRNGAHSARTMMLDEISALLLDLPDSAARSEYQQQVIEYNLLAKRTQKTRQLTFRHLAELYGLDQKLPLFRMFRKLWALDEDARPLLALSMALARDPLLRLSEDFLLAKPLGCAVTTAEMVTFIEQELPGRFSAASSKSFAQNINATWTHAGFLRGKVKKIRCQPKITPANAAFSIFLGYLEGLSGQMLFSTRWTNLLECSSDELAGLVASAANGGLLVFLNAGGIMEVRFPDFLSAEEEKWIHEQDQQTAPCV